MIKEQGKDRMVRAEELGERIGRRIQQLRRRRQLTQGQLADRLARAGVEVVRTTVTHHEAQGPHTVRQLVGYADALDAELEVRLEEREAE